MRATPIRISTNPFAANNDRRRMISPRWRMRKLRICYPDPVKCIQKIHQVDWVTSMVLQTTYHVAQNINVESIEGRAKITGRYIEFCKDLYLLPLDGNPVGETEYASDNAPDVASGLTREVEKERQQDTDHILSKNEAARKTSNLRLREQGTMSVISSQASIMSEDPKVLIGQMSNLSQASNASEDNHACTMSDLNQRSGECDLKDFQIYSLDWGL